MQAHAHPQRSGSASHPSFLQVDRAVHGAGERGAVGEHRVGNPSPVVFTCPPWASIALRTISSWWADAERMASGNSSHRRVESSRSVNKRMFLDGNSATPTPRYAGRTPASLPVHVPFRHCRRRGRDRGGVRAVRSVVRLFCSRQCRRPPTRWGVASWRPCRSTRWPAAVHDAGSAGHVPAEHAYGHRFAERYVYGWSVETNTARPGRTRPSLGIGRTMYGVSLELLDRPGLSAGVRRDRTAQRRERRSTSSTGFHHIGTYDDVGFKLGVLGTTSGGGSVARHGRWHTP